MTPPSIGKIGVFDSGLGGLIITHSLTEALPQYDYLYLGDAKHMPYGNRSSEQVYEYTLSAVDFLFKQGCELIIIACNTASAEALRRVQQEYLPKLYPDRRVLGVLIPAVEAAVAATKSGQIGVIATSGTVKAGTFATEIAKADKALVVTQLATPLLVPLIEYNGDPWISEVTATYLEQLKQAYIDTLVLGCTHYPAIKEIVRSVAGDTITVISHDEVVPNKLGDYLSRHNDLAERLSHGHSRTFYVTDATDGSTRLAQHLYGADVNLQLVEYPVEG